ncbi:MAG: phosphate/phosphite/phosphonate ABC transporter substrate-binding protein [Sulfuricella sp.]|nr:phosphate/phosphite/phosphonate ABC transporter substrate-binding protein [Sulfuricella sp.]
MRKRLALFLTALFGFWAAVATAAEAPLSVGVFPYLSARSLLTLYQPLHQYLEKELGVPVQFYTAPDFKTFVQRTHQHQYQVVITAPHLARLAQTESGYVPLANYASELRAVVVVAMASPIVSLDELRSKVVAVPDRLAVIPMIGLQLLRERGLRAEADFRLRASQTHGNAVLAVRRGEADAAVVGSLPLSQLPGEVQDEMRTLAVSGPIPSQFIMADPRLPPKLIERLRRALIAFPTTPEGERFVEENGMGGIQAAKESDLKKLDAYAHEVRVLLGAPQ